MTIESLSVFNILGYCERQDYKGLVSYLLTGIQNLEGAGVQYAALTGITPHIVFDELEKKSPIPLVSMLDTAREYAAKSGYARVGLLGKSPTMNGNFFQKAFEKKNIEVITPLDQEKDYIGSKIETELEYGKVNPDTQKNFRKIAERMISEDKIQAVVLGCTELPLIFKSIRLTVPYIDVSRVHIDALIDIAAR